MIFLDSPSLNAPKEKWVEWLGRLDKMNKRDETVKFAIARARRVIETKEAFEAQHAQELQTA